MNSQENDGVESFLVHCRNRGADSWQIAESIAASGLALAASLTPIIGQRGVAALYQRSLHLAARTYPWISAAQDSAPESMDIMVLRSLLAKQTSTQAATAGALVLQTFYDLLATLIGLSLTEQLLRSAWAYFLSGPSTPDTTS